MGRPAVRWALRAAAFTVIALAAIACGESSRPAPSGIQERRTITGATMGTTFAVTVVAGDAAVAGSRAGASRTVGESDAVDLQAAVQRRLDEIEGRMSHYRVDSELSRFNRARTTGPWPLSRETLGVVEEALAVGRASGGAFDVTVGPLVEAWGFGPDGRAPAIPDEAALTALRARVGVDLLEVDLAAGTLRKRREDVVVDLSAIAKGYAVDAVATLLADLGFGDYLVEIGGELRAAGTNEAGNAVAGRHRAAGSGRAGGAAHPAPDGRRPRHVRRLPQLLRPRRRAGFAHRRSAYGPPGHPRVAVGERRRRPLQPGRRPIDGAERAGAGRRLRAGGRAGDGPRCS